MSIQTTYEDEKNSQTLNVTENEPPTEEPEPAPEVDYKQKFSASSAENQRILAEKARIEQENAELKAKLEQTSNENLAESDLIKINPDYELMSQTERTIFKQSIENDITLKKLAAKEKWREEYDSLPDDLIRKINAKGGERTFKSFACSPENAGMKSITNLAKSFLFDFSEEPEDKLIPKRDGLDKGTGGGKPIKTRVEGELTAAEAADMRINNPRKYDELARAGKLKIK